MQDQKTFIPKKGGKEILTTFLFFLQFYAYICFTLECRTNYFFKRLRKINYLQASSRAYAWDKKVIL